VKWVRSPECSVEEDNASDSDLWALVTNCIKVKYIRLSNPKPVLLVAQPRIRDNIKKYSREMGGSTITNFRAETLKRKYIAINK
jgi:hypothetical protein